ncbi:hypothetical protein GB937_003010 [Aspergillus fischeri]|nr:hypothetical protein GB937_003010 [Aspergillus fischeri]
MSNRREWAKNWEMAGNAALSRTETSQEASLSACPTLIKIMRDGGLCILTRYDKTAHVVTL